MNKNTYSLHHINNQIDYGFTAHDYSKFKFGSKKVARNFGKSLGDGFVKHRLSSFKNDFQKQIVVLSSPYGFIPTATFAMKDYFVPVVNQWLVDNELSPLEELKVYRNTTYREDYGALSKEERLKLIGNDKFYIDKKFIKGKILLFLDDIKITGAHEKMVTQMCQDSGLDNDCYFIYFAELMDRAIPASFENYLNYAFVKNLNDLDYIIKNEDFLINTRVVKFILNNEQEAVATFLYYQSTKFLETLYHCAIGNGYHMIPDYGDNLSKIKIILNIKKERYER